MSNLSVEQQKLIRELKTAYPELKGLSDEQILTVYNEQMSQIKLDEDQQVSVMGLDVQSDEMGLLLQSTTKQEIKKLSEEEKEQLKNILLQRISVTEDKTNEINNSFISSMLLLFSSYCKVAYIFLKL